MIETWKSDFSHFVILVSRFTRITRDVLTQRHNVTDMEGFSQLEVKDNNCKSLFIHCSVAKFLLHKISVRYKAFQREDMWMGKRS